MPHELVNHELSVPSTKPLPTEIQAELRSVAWKWLKVMGAIVIGVVATFGGVVGWAIYNVATGTATTVAQGTVADLTKVLSGQTDRVLAVSDQLIKDTSDAAKRLSEIIGELKSRAHAADEAALKATSAADAATRVAQQAVDQFNAAVTAQSTTTDLTAAADKALRTYVDSSSFKIGLIREMEERYDPKIQEIVERAKASNERLLDLSGLEFLVTDEVIEMSKGYVDVRCPSTHTFVTPVCQVVPKPTVGPEAGYIYQASISYENGVGFGRCRLSITFGGSIGVGGHAICARWRDTQPSSSN